MLCCDCSKSISTIQYHSQTLWVLIVVCVYRGLLSSFLSIHSCLFCVICHGMNKSGNNPFGFWVAFFYILVLVTCWLLVILCHTYMQLWTKSTRTRCPVGTYHNQCWHGVEDAIWYCLSKRIRIMHWDKHTAISDLSVAVLLHYYSSIWVDNVLY